MMDTTENHAETAFSAEMERRVARLETRFYDWNTLGFQASVDTSYRRAQIRYIGTGAAGVLKDDNTVPAGSFTFSNMVLPAGSRGPLHVHNDAEEVFFVLRGKKIVMEFEKDGMRCTKVLNERDLVSVPPGVYRSFHNEGGDEALLAVVIGAPQPQLPNYHPEDPIHGTSR